MQKELITLSLILLTSIGFAQNTKDLKNELDRQAADLRGNGNLKCKIKGASIIFDPLVAYISNDRLYVEATARGKEHAGEKIFLEFYLKPDGPFPYTLLFNEKQPEKSGFVGKYIAHGPTQPFQLSKSGKITITKFEKDGRHFSGTFEFLGKKVNPANTSEQFYADIQISDGIFEIYSYKTE